MLGEEFHDSTNQNFISNKINNGRPRITAEEVLVFICLCGYINFVTDQKSAERMTESISLYIYYSNRNKKMPRPKTINENLNCISNEKVEFIQHYQLDQFLNKGLDSFNYAVLYSTSVSV